METIIQNLDRECAEYGYKISGIEKISEPLIRKSLGVLQEDGLYAFALYLYSRGTSEKKVTQKIEGIILNFLKKLRIISNEQNDLKKAIREEIARDLDKILLSKQVLERALIYALYHVKGGEEREESG